MLLRIVLLFICLNLGLLSAHTQNIDQWVQINYEDLTPEIMNALNEEIARMNLEFIRFNFYKHRGDNLYPVEFLRKGVDITALGGLEYLIFSADGSVQEKRYKFYSDELLISTPLEMIMIMQEKTKNQQLKYLNRIEVSGKQPYYQANTTDSVFVFNEKMEFLRAEQASIEALN